MPGSLQEGLQLHFSRQIAFDESVDHIVASQLRTLLEYLPIDSRQVSRVLRCNDLIVVLLGRVALMLRPVRIPL